MSGLLISQDLMLQSQCVQAGKAYHMPMACTSGWTDVIARCQTDGIQVVIVDLATVALPSADWMQEFQTALPQVERIAVGPHVHRDALAQAEQAGWQAWTRGQLHAGLGTLLGRLRDTR